MGQLRLWMVHNGLGLGVHPGQAAMCIHVLNSTADDRVAWLMWQAPVWQRLLHGGGLRVHEGVMLHPCRRPLLWHAMRQHLNRTPLQALRVLHDLLRVEIRVPQRRLLAVVVMVLERHRGGQVLVADALHAAMALLWMQGRRLHAGLRMLMHGDLHLMRGAGDAPHGDVLLCMLRGCVLGRHMLLWWQTGLTCLLWSM